MTVWFLSISRTEANGNIDFKSSRWLPDAEEYENKGIIWYHIFYEIQGKDNMEK